MASMAARMPLPTAVRRPGSGSSGVEQDLPVGGRRLDELREPRERDEPDEGARLGCRSMNAAAASSAATSRLGAMSVEHMLRDTSMTIRMVVWLVGTLTTAAGRAIATTMAAADAANSANGRWRRTRDVPGRAAAMSDRLEKRTAARPRRRWTTMYSATSAGTSTSSTEQGCPEQGHGSRPDHVSAATPPRVRNTSPSAATSEVTSVVSASTTRRVSSVS